MFGCVLLESLQNSLLMQGGEDIVDDHLFGFLLSGTIKDLISTKSSVFLLFVCKTFKICSF